MDNREFSELAKKVLKIAEEKARGRAKKSLKYVDFILDMKDDQFGPRMTMWFHGNKEVVFKCEYDMENDGFKE